MAQGRKLNKLTEITNTPRSKKIIIQEPEVAHVVADEEIIDLHLENSEDEIFSDLQLDFKDLEFILNSNE